MEYASAISFIERSAAGDYTEAEHREFIDWLFTASAREVQGVMDAAMAGRLALDTEQTADPGLVGRIEAALDQFEEESRQEHEEQAGQVPAQETEQAAEEERVAPGRIRRFPRFTVAAAIILLLAGAGW